MLPEHSPSHVSRAYEAFKPVEQFLAKYERWVREAGPDVCDFAVGNPHEMALRGFVSALEKAVAPQDKDWYAYKFNEPRAVGTVARALMQQFGRPFESRDIFMTNGATGAIDVVLNTVLDSGDEVIFNSPPWFFYESMVINSGGKPVRVRVDPESYDLDLAAIDAAITERTRLIIVNSPNNPTGRIYPAETLQALGEVLERASSRYGRRIYLLSDEAYRRIVYDGRAYHSPTGYYHYSFMVYTYGKTLLTPGQRLGYVALPPEMPERDRMRNAVAAVQFLSGFATTNALLQHALPDIQPLSIDIEHLQSKRDRLVDSLRKSGYLVHNPEGTFYLLPRSPIKDDVAFADMMAEEGVLCLPGQVVEMPGYFRVSLTASDEMVERAIPLFDTFINRVH